MAGQMTGDSLEEPTGMPKRVQLLRKRRAVEQRVAESTAAKAANLSKKLTSGFDLKSLDSSEAVHIGLQNLPEFCGELIDRSDIERLSTELDQLRWTLEKRMQNFQEDLIDEAEDLNNEAKDSIYEAENLVYDAEDLIDEIINHSPKFKLSAEYPFGGTHVCSVKSKIESALAKIQDCKSLLLGSDEVFPVQLQRFEGHRDGPTIADRDLINLKNIWKHEVNSIRGSENFKELISQVLGGGEEFQVIGLLGEGGIGKTTLAKAVYRDINVRRSFNCFAWVRVGDPFSSRRVLEDILISITSHGWEEMIPYTDMDLAEMLYNFLEQKRYLIVLDDVWDEDAWDCLNISFPQETGSRLLLTTRLSEVAYKITGSAKCFVHQVRSLTEEESLELLFRTAFRAQRSDPKDELERIEIAKEIVRACSGTPLMVKLVGGILTSKPTPFEWKIVQQNIVSSRNEGIKGVTHATILNLAYDSLPYYLKPCFLYTALFPKGVEIKAKLLYQLWLAEGFIVNPSGKMSSMEIAEWYMFELHDKGMISLVKQQGFNATLLFKSYHLHDLLYDLCILKQMESNFCISIQNPGRPYGGEKPSSQSSLNSLHRISRLALYFEYGSFVPLKRKKKKNPDSQRQSIPFPKLSDLGNASGIKGLYLRPSNCRWRLTSVNSLHFLDKVDLAMLSDLDDLERLRFLDCDGISFDLMRLSRIMEKLFSLRYLNLRKCNVESLPSTISNLLNLQTLYLPEYTRERVIIPSELQRLSSLMFLYLPRCFELQGGGKLQMDRLRNLEELVNFDSEVCELKGLWNLKKLKRLVAIVNGTSEDLKEVNRSVETNCLAFLSLVIRMPEYYSKENYSVIEDLWRLPNLGALRLKGILGNLLPVCFPHSLNKLSFNGSKLDEDPMGKLEMLPNLCVLKLYNNAVVTKYMTCSDLGMPQLRHLTISKLDNLENLEVEKGGMPNLSTLVLEKCQRLKDLSEGLSFLTSLEEVKISYMPPAFVDRLKKAGGDRHAYVVKTNQLF